MRTVRYRRTEFHGPEKEVENDLLSFIYDVLYFGICRVLPPRAVLNEILAGGSLGGGMSPGATWGPFQGAEAGYAELGEAVAATPVEELRERARFCGVQYRRDADLDWCADADTWAKAVGEKHRRQPG